MLTLHNIKGHYTCTTGPRFCIAFDYLSHNCMFEIILLGILKVRIKNCEKVISRVQSFTFGLPLSLKMKFQCGQNAHILHAYLSK